MKKTVVSIVGASLLLCSSAFASGGEAHWTYSGHEGPGSWGSLSEEYAVCSSGKNQSPINIANAIEAELQPVTVNYQAAPLDVVNNGHTVKASYAPGSTITVEGRTFKLLQVHFHSPSENAVDGKLFDMEAHFVHADDQGNLAVIGVMYNKGDANSALETIWNNMPEKAGEASKPAGVTLDANAMLPANQDYYRFNGSLTTPPCSEGVLWMVMKNPVTASAEQIEKFKHIMHHDNNRPLQPTNARPVLQ
jgi:carbonic anhydrase